MLLNRRVVEALEGRLSEALGESIEIIGFHDSPPSHEDSQYWVGITYDGRDNRGYRGNVYFNARLFDDGVVEDFEIVNLTGQGYVKTPWSA